MGPHSSANSVPQPPRKAKSKVDISAVLDRHLAAYAVVASAAAVGVPALGQAATDVIARVPELGENNTIVYTPANISFYIAPGRSYHPLPILLDLNNDGVADAAIQRSAFGYSVSGTGGSYSWFKANASWSAVSGGIERPLSSGAEIGPKGVFGQKGLLAHSIFSNRRGHRHPKDGCYGPFKNRNAYLGIRFSISGKIHYGWIRISLNCGDYSINGTVTGYAYRTIANKPIEAGQTESDPASEPEPESPATLGALSLGSPGLPFWRRLTGTPGQTKMPRRIGLSE